MELHKPMLINTNSNGVAHLVAKLIINQDTLERLRNGQPWGAFAEQIGVDGGTLSRVRRGHSQPGPGFIANVVTNFPVRIDELVTVVDDAA